jgi:hypothetical protein
MYAPCEHAGHLCHRVLSVACPGFLTVADIKGDVGATHEPTVNQRQIDRGCHFPFYTARGVS